MSPEAWIAIDPSVDYPPDNDLSPSPRPPEYRFGTSGHASQMQPGGVYGLFRLLLTEAGADKANIGRTDWNPLRRWVKPDDRVFVLPNLVMHRRTDRGERLSDFRGKCTDGSVLRAVCDYTLLAARSPSQISVGSAPIQACDFRRVCQEARIAQIFSFYRDHSAPITGPLDLRGVVSQWSQFGTLRERQTVESDYSVRVDLGRESLLDEFYTIRTQPPPRFVVGDYSPSDTAKYHGPGRHVYVVDRRVLDADLVIHVPKLKTHQKVGITCSLKGCVGSIVRKECLAHHRSGSSAGGGDEYAHQSSVFRLASTLLERSAGLDAGSLANLQRFSAKALTKALSSMPQASMPGSWPGNDTAWRMAIDIARILHYAGRDGRLHDVPQRRHLVVIDGIVGGEGDGPLKPTGRSRGAIILSDNVLAADYAASTLMGFDPHALPLLEGAKREMRFQLPSMGDPPGIRLNGLPISHSTLVALAEPFLPPKGWDRLMHAKR
jgi:uncharacterized protein (DUF362 family)